MVPIDSPWVTSCSTSIDPNIVSVTVFEIPNLKSLALPIPEITEGVKNYKSISSDENHAPLAYFCTFGLYVKNNGIAICKGKNAAP